MCVAAANQALLLVDRTATELKRRPNGATALLKHADALWKLDRHLEALHFVERSLDHRPHATAHLLRAHILHHLKRYSDALTSYTDAIRLQSDLPAAHRWRASCLHELGRNGEALVAMDAALAIRPADAEALVARSDILRALDRPDDAAAACRLSLEFEPDRPETVLALAVALHAAGRWEAALIECHRAVKLEPTSTEAHAQRVAAFLALKRFDDAIASVRPLTHGPSPQAEHVLLLAQTLAEADRRGEALETVEIAIALDPLTADAHIMRAGLLNGISANGAPPDADQKSLEQAVRSYEHALAVERDPKATAWIRSCRAATLYALARDDEAFVDVVAAEGRPGATPALPALKAAVLFRLERHVDALAVADTVLASNRTVSEQALQIRVLALAKIGRHDEARTDAARYLILFGDDDEVRVVALTSSSGPTPSGVVHQ